VILIVLILPVQEIQNHACTYGR